MPSTPADTDKEFEVAPPVFMPSFDMQPGLLPTSRNVPVLPADSLRSDQFVPLKLEWESLDDPVSAAELETR